MWRVRSNRWSKSMLRSLSALLLAWASVASASDDHVGPALSHMLNQGGEVVDSFAVSEELNGWVIAFDGEQRIVYTTPSGEHLLVGAVLGAGGENLTRSHHRGSIEREGGTIVRLKPDAESQNVADLQRSAHFRTGSIGPNVYVFYEPNCGACLEFTRRFGERDDVVLSWVPVEFMGATSAPAAAAMLDSEDAKATLLAWNEAKWGRTTSDFLSENPVSAERMTAVRGELRANSELMRRLGVVGTPAVVGVAADGSIGVLRGIPSEEEFSALIARM